MTVSQASSGAGIPTQLVGDYRNPILTPFAAAIVKRKGEQAPARGFPSSEDQCRPIAPPNARAGLRREQSDPFRLSYSLGRQSRLLVMQHLTDYRRAGDYRSYSL